MNNFLETYLKERYLESQKKQMQKQPGPLVTISREFGCDAQYISASLAFNLNSNHKQLDQEKDWEIISKEILKESANVLKTDEKNIEHIFTYEKRSILDDFFQSFTSTQYHCDLQIRTTIRKVVYAFAEEGYSIILGRAGAQITRDIEKSLHVRLVAPFDWRVEHVMEKHNLNEKAANKLVKEMDENRKEFIEHFSKEVGCNYCYDVFYNVKFLTNDQIVSDIVHMMQLRKLI
jgi:cytidylate kinase